MHSTLPIKRTLNMDYDLKTLGRLINTLDTYYEFSDNKNRFNDGMLKENAITHWLHGLTDAETIEVLKMLDKRGHTNYNRYFKNK